MARIKPAMAAHCNIYRKDPPISYTFRVEMARNWTAFTYPPHSPPTNTEEDSKPSTPIDSQPGTQQDLSHEEGDAQQQRINGRRRPNPPRVSALQLSLRAALKPASSTENLLYHVAEELENA